MAAYCPRSAGSPHRPQMKRAAASHRLSARGRSSLLLTLARNQKVDLAKISILELVDQYLGFVEDVLEHKKTAAERWLGSSVSVLTEGERAIAEHLAPILWARGLLIVGLDVIGDRLTEINVTSPTCMVEITDQTGFDVPGAVIDTLEEVCA